MNIEELINACKKNNRQAQNELYQRYKDILYIVSFKYCRNIKDAEDNLHDAFLSIFKSLNSYKNKGSFEGWMKWIVINKSSDNYKKRKYLTNELREHILTVKEENVEIPENTTGIRTRTIRFF